MSDGAATTINAQLVAGEELIWTGTPLPGFWARRQNIWNVLLFVGSLVFVVLEVRDLGAARSLNLDPSLAFTGASVIGILTGLIYDTIRRKNSYFGLTDRRAISVYWLFGLRVESASFARIGAVTVARQSDGSGTMTFGLPPKTQSGTPLGVALDDWPMSGPVIFDLIECVDDVATSANAMVLKRMEEEWDAAIASLTLAHARSGDFDIAYVDAGSGDPIIFLHGVGATKRCWALQMHALAHKFRCIALDYRGYGDSDVPPLESISRENFARDVAAVMDAAGVEKAVLCGNSLGGVVALEFYKQFPTRVKSLILVDSFAYYPGGAESIPDRIKTLDDLGIEKFAETRSSALFGPDAPAWLVERARADLASIPLAVYKASTRVTWSGDYRTLLPTIDVGALVIWGEYDTKITPRPLSEELAHGIPACGDVSEIPRAGHIPQMENPIAFNANVADYLK